MTVVAVSVIETFRDPAGSLRVEANQEERKISTRCAAALGFLTADLAREWVSQGWLIGTTWLDNPAHNMESCGDQVLRPRVLFPSSPWERTSGVWVAAGSLTLDPCEGQLIREIPLLEITALLRDLTLNWVIVEWGPHTDPRFVKLVRDRNQICGHFNEQAFLAAMQRHFLSVLNKQLPNGHILYLFQPELSQG